MKQQHAAFEKTVRLGTKPRHEGSEQNMSVYAKIRYSKDGKLSICGVEGPFSNGNAAGSCGQIYDHLDIERPAPKWDAAMIAKFADIWDKWHLNDCTPNCEHQIGEAWTPKNVEIITYRLNDETWKAQKALKKSTDERLLTGKSVTLTDDEIGLLELPWETKRTPDADAVGRGCYDVQKRETKSTGWLTEHDHPDGYLSKPCPVCGYKYGSKWLTVEVPADVLDWLQALPDTDKEPAWV